jgi:hypothetical protein
MNAPQRALPKVKNSENRDLQKVPPLLPAHKTFLQPSRLYCYTSSRHYIKLKSDISRTILFTLLFATNQVSNGKLPQLYLLLTKCIADRTSEPTNQTSFMTFPDITLLKTNLTLLLKASNKSNHQHPIVFTIGRPSSRHDQAHNILPVAIT